MKRLVFVLASAGGLVLLALAACGGGSGDGGANNKWSIDGPGTVSPGKVATYTAVVTGDTATSWKWTIAGNGSITGSGTEETVKVRAATDGGSFTISCRMRNDNWVSDRSLEVAVRNPYARFRVVLSNAPNFAVTSLTGSGRLEMTSNDAEAATWAVYFEGDRAHLPAQVPVTITTTNGQWTLLNYWLAGTEQSRALSFPRAGGGTVGNGGTVLDVGANRPDCVVGGPGESATVRLEANGVETMVITVFYQ